LRVRGQPGAARLRLGAFRLRHLGPADEARLGARPRRSAALLLQRRHHRHQAAEVSALPTWWHWARWVIANRAWSHHHLLGYLRMLRARARVPGLVFEGPCFIGPDVQFQVAPGT